VRKEGAIGVVIAEGCMTGAHRVSHILVTSEAFQATHPYELVSANIAFVNELLHNGPFSRDELPVEAMWSYHVDFYQGQVYNGGHEQFIGNSGWQTPILEDIDAGLNAVGAFEELALFREVREYVDADAEERQKMMARRGFDHPVHGKPSDWLSKRDRELFSLGKLHGELYVLNSRWLKSLSNVRCCPRSIWKSEMTNIISANRR
jgi:hypothetical protein